MASVQVTNDVLEPQHWQLYVALCFSANGLDDRDLRGQLLQERVADCYASEEVAFVNRFAKAAVAVAATADPIVRQKECSPAPSLWLWMDRQRLLTTLQGTDFFGTVTCKQIPAQEVLRAKHSHVF